MLGVALLEEGCCEGICGVIGRFNEPSVGVAFLQWLHKSTGGKAPVEGEGERILRFERKLEIEAIFVRFRN